MNSRAALRWIYAILGIVLLVLIAFRIDWQRFDQKVSAVSQALSDLGGKGTPQASSRAQMNPLEILWTLSLASILGGLVSFRRRSDAMHVSIVQAHMILSASAALMMIIIGSELARAFGLMGAASIVRYRYSLTSPREASSLIVALGMGMACGTGLYLLAILSAVVVWIILHMFEWIPSSIIQTVFETRRYLNVNILTIDYQGTLRRLQDVCARHDIAYVIRSYTFGAPGTEEPTELTVELRLDSQIKESDLTREIVDDHVKTLSWKRIQKQKGLIQ